MTILFIVGARPQFIKLSPLCRAVSRYNESVRDDSIRSVIVHTGQHYDYEMSKGFFDQMQIPEPDVNLEVGSGSQAAQTGLMLERIEPVLDRERPDIVVVFGDTNSTLAGALAAAKLRLPVAHIEAGLRSYNKEMPEELNRVVTDHLSTLLFCPTKRAIANLESEGFRNMVGDGDEPAETMSRFGPVTSSNPLVIKGGDVMCDALMFNAALAEKESEILTSLALVPGKYGVVTIHRAENTSSDPSFRKLMKFLERDGDSMPLVFPVHPRTEKFIETNNIAIPKNIRMLPPASYFDMLMLEKHAARIYTDSGGMQKEAYLFKVPCVTLRNETEWPETVESGWNRLMNSDGQSPSAPIWDATLFGDGKAAEKQINLLIEYNAIV